MKLTKLLNLMMLGAVLAFTATGCHKKPQGITPLHNSQTRPGGMPQPEVGNQPPIGGGEQPQTFPNPANTGGPTPTGGGPLTGGDRTGWNANTDVLKEQTIHFAFDKSAIRSDDKSKLDAVATYLKGAPTAAVRVEGNCDERGTEEYNRSLGERRALAAREYLVHAGIEASRIDTISYGFDRPVDPARTEEAYAQNRRDNFVVLTPP